MQFTVPEKLNSKNRGTGRFSRRMASVVLASVAVIGLMAGCATAEDPSGSQGQGSNEYEGQTVVIFGSLSMKDLLEGPVAEEASSKYGITVEHVPMLSSEVLTKLIATKDKPDADMAIIGDIDYWKGQGSGLWGPLSATDVPNIAQLPAEVQPEHYANNAVGLYTGGAILEYNKEEFAKNGIPAPTSVADLMNPKLKGHVGLTSLSSGVGIQQLVAFARHGGGSEKDIEPGFEYAKELVDAGQIAMFGRNGAELSQALANKEIWVAFQYDSSAFKDHKADPNLGVVYAKAAPPLFSVVTPTMNTTKRAAALKVIEILIGPKAQEMIGETVFTIPVLTDAGSDANPGEEEVELGRISYDKLNKYTGWPVANNEYIASQRESWYSRWIAEIEAGS